MFARPNRSGGAQWTRYAPAAFAALALLLPLRAIVGASPPAEQLEYQVRAAFLLNFTRFIEWPVPGGADPSSPFAICIAGDDPFGKSLGQIVQGEAVKGRRIVVRHIGADPAADCGIMYFAGRKGAREDLARAGPGVLTVGEGDEFLDDGGMIAFVIDNRRVRFDIDRSTAMKAGLSLSSRLLNVARIVR